MWTCVHNFRDSQGVVDCCVVHSYITLSIKCTVLLVPYTLSVVQEGLQHGARVVPGSGPFRHRLPASMWYDVRQAWVIAAAMGYFLAVCNREASQLLCLARQSCG